MKIAGLSGTLTAQEPLPALSGVNAQRCTLFAPIVSLYGPSPPQAYIFFVVSSAHKAKFFEFGAVLLILVMCTVEFVHDVLREMDSVMFTEEGKFVSVDNTEK